MKNKFGKVLKGLLLAVLAIVLVTSYQPGDANAATSKVVKKGQAFDIIVSDSTILHTGMEIEVLTEDTVYDLVYYSGMFELHPVAHIIMDGTTDFDATVMGAGLFDKASYSYDDEHGESYDKLLLGTIKVKKGKVRVRAKVYDFTNGVDKNGKFTAKKVNHGVYNSYKLKANESYVFNCEQRAKSKWTNNGNGNFYMLVEGKVGTTLTSSFTYGDTTYTEYMKLGKKNVDFTNSYNENEYKWDYISSKKNTRTFMFTYEEGNVPCITTEFVADKAMTVYLPYEYTLTRIE